MEPLILGGDEPHHGFDGSCMKDVLDGDDLSATILSSTICTTAFEVSATGAEEDDDDI